MNSVSELEARLADPSEALIADLTRLDGDLLVLGAGGKMGPSLTRLAMNAVTRSGRPRRVMAVSRFSNPAHREELTLAGVEVHAADLLNDAQLQALPDAANVIYMAGTKFGTSSDPAVTWASNAYLPGRVAEKYRHSRIVAFSTGNVYPLTPVARGGSSEEDATGPVGEYAQSCLGRERIIQYFSQRHGTPAVLLRLNYAIDLRYGVLLEIAQAVQEGRPVDVSMGAVNVIWQGDANEAALRSLLLAESPARILNITGPETVSVRWLAERFGELLNRDPVIAGEEHPTALLNNASRAHDLLGYPRVTLRQLMTWTAEWVRQANPTLGKPTRFQEREGAF